MTDKFSSFLATTPKQICLMQEASNEKILQWKCNNLFWVPVKGGEKGLSSADISSSTLSVFPFL